MKELGIIIGGTLAILAMSVLLLWGIMAGLRGYWQSGCEADGYRVVSNGYGTSKTYWCINSEGNIIDVF